MKQEIENKYFLLLNMKLKIFLKVSLLLVSLFLNNISYAKSNPSNSELIHVFSNLIKSPNPTKKSLVLTLHNDTRVDNYSWLRDPKWPEIKDLEILKYIEEENHYTNRFFEHLSDLQEKLYQEIRGRIKEEESTYPIQDGGYLYYDRYENGKNYKIHCRKIIGNTNEEILLDENKVAEGRKFFSLSAFSISHDHQNLAYSTDESGQEIYTLRIKNLITGDLHPDVLENVAGDAIIWHKNIKGFFYLKFNDKQRADCVYFHKLGDLQSNDLLVYQEKDETFLSGEKTGLSYSSDRKYAFLNFSSSNASEIRYISLESESMIPKILIPRKDGQVYKADTIKDQVYILINDKGSNFRLIRTTTEKLKPQEWEEILPNEKSSFLSEIFLYQDHIVLQVMQNGLPKIIVRPLKNIHQADEVLFEKESSYEASIDFTRHNDQFLRIKYSSLSTPEMIYEYDFTTKRIYSRKIKSILGGFNSKNYRVERIMAPSKDGTLVPISLVYRKDQRKTNLPNPLLLDGYGAYGLRNDASFSFKIISLLDRGFIYAIVHIRGGNEMGYYWYEDGKLLKKKHTFEDFIGASEYLIDKGYTEKKKIALFGSSAGGILMGYCANERPDLYKAVVARVPFVDVLNTMLDENIPLTPGEFKEWGNPKEAQFYHYIKSYSPYDNVKVQEYPHMYVTAGLNDPRVTYWEPLKWVAKLREFKTDKNLLLLDMKKEGHFGSSGRFSYIKDEAAKQYAFLLAVFDLEKAEIQKGFVETCRQMFNKIIKSVINFV